MTKQVNYTDTFDADSDVIDKVYYDEKYRELYVVLNSGTVIGYSSVPRYTFDHFRGAISKGSFWNRSIKGYFRGISGDVQFVAPKPAEHVSAESLNVPSATEFTVVVEVSGTLKITGSARDATDALRKANEILAQTFEGTAKVKELRQSFV